MLRVDFILPGRDGRLPNVVRIRAGWRKTETMRMSTNQVGAETTLALSGLTEKQRHSITLIRYLLNFYCSQKWI